MSCTGSQRGKTDGKSRTEETESRMGQRRNECFGGSLDGYQTSSSERRNWNYLLASYYICFVVTSCSVVKISVCEISILLIKRSTLKCSQQILLRSSKLPLRTLFYGFWKLWWDYLTSRIKVWCKRQPPVQKLVREGLGVLHASLWPFPWQNSRSGLSLTVQIARGLSEPPGLWVHRNDL